MNSQMQYSLATKNLGLVHREDKGEAAVLQKTLLRTAHARRTPPRSLENSPLQHCRRNMAGMTQDMALVEFVIVHSLKNG